MKEYLEKRIERLSLELKRINDYLNLSKQDIIKGGNVIGFKYVDRKPTKTNESIKAKLAQRDKLKRKIRKANKQLANI